MSSKSCVQFLALAFICLGLTASPSRAAGGADLNISPKRVVFGPADRTATVFVFNRGTEPAVYAVELVDRTMQADGQIVAAAAGETPSAKPFITYTPRRVTLAPGESQTVRLRVLRPADLATGEYRTHFTVTALPPEDTGLTAEQASAPLREGQIGTRLTTLISLSIPLIVRQGPADAKAALENARYAVETVQTEAGGSAQVGVVTVDLVRRGVSSLYGDLEVRGDKGAKSSAIGGVRGLGVYPEIGQRSVRIVLTQNPTRGERLTVVFKDDDTAPGVALATATVVVP